MILGDYKIITITTGRLRQNCYLVQHSPSKDLLLIDPGDKGHHILEIVKSVGSRLKHILLTHAHYDHVGAVKEVSDTFHLPFMMHKDDVKLFNRAPMYALAFEKKSLEISKNYCFFGDEALTWGGHSIQILNLPGHTPGGVCIYFDNLAFTGDILLKGFLTHKDLPGANIEDLHSSIRKMLGFLDSDTLLFPGHGRPWSLNEAAQWWHEQQQLVVNQ